MAQAEETATETTPQYEEAFSYMDILQAQYDDIVEHAKNCNVTIDEDLTFDYYVESYYAQNSMLPSDFLAYILENISYLSTTNTPILESETLSLENLPATMSVNSSWWENIEQYENGLPFTPCYDYFLPNLVPGDIIDEYGVSGTGHTAIVEGFNTTLNYWTVIESLNPAGVCRSIIDNNRIIKNKSVILRVTTVNQDQRDLAVSFCRDQISDSYNFSFIGDKVSSSDAWLCSTLVWAGYYSIGIDICPSSITCYPWDIANSSLVTEVNCIKYKYLSFKIIQSYYTFPAYWSWSVNISNPNNFSVSGQYNSRLCNFSDAKSFNQDSLKDEKNFSLSQNNTNNASKNFYIEHNGTAGYITAYYTLTLGTFTYKVITYADQLKYTSGVGSCMQYHNIVDFE